MADPLPQAAIEKEPVYVSEDLIIPPYAARAPTPSTTISVPLQPTSEKGIIINIETTGLSPIDNNIIAIGILDPEFPDSNPTIIMLTDEALMIRTLFAFIKEGGYTQIIGYGLGFDFRFLLFKAMKHSISCKEFYDMELYDLMEAVGQGKMSYVYYAQKPLALSDVADFLWKYPKPYPDAEMIKAYQEGAFEKVLEFASGQITRTLLLYISFRSVTETPISELLSGIAEQAVLSQPGQPSPIQSLLTIPEAGPATTWQARCPTCLGEWDVLLAERVFKCPIDGTEIGKP